MTDSVTELVPARPRPQGVGSKTVKSTGSQSEGSDSNRNMLRDLTKIVRTTTIDNGGCCFTIIERDGKIEVQTSCNGHGSDWVDILGDSSAQTVIEVAPSEKSKKHGETRTKYYVCKEIEVFPRSSRNNSTTATAVTPSGTSASTSSFAPSDSSVECPGSRVTDSTLTQSTDQSPRPSNEAPPASGVCRFGLLRKLKSGQAQEEDES